MPKIAQIEVTGVQEAMTNMTERLIENGSKSEPVIKISVQMDKDGFASIGEIIVWGEIKEDEGFAAKLKGFFGSSKNETSDEEDETSQTTSATASASESVSGSDNTTATTTSTASPSPTLSAKQRSTIKLQQETTYLGILPMTGTEIRKSRDRYVWFWYQREVTHSQCLG
jgi:hypothetical protein